MAKAGRNDPCPCGSGKKYKRCCFGLHQAASRERTRLIDEPVPVEQFEAEVDELCTLSNRVGDLIRAGDLDDAEQVGRELLRRFPDQMMVSRGSLASTTLVAKLTRPPSTTARQHSSPNAATDTTHCSSPTCGAAPPNSTPEQSSRPTAQSPRPKKTDEGHGFPLGLDLKKTDSLQVNVRLWPRLLPKNVRADTVPELCRSVGVSRAMSKLRP